MASQTITITAASEMELLTRKNALEEVNKLPTDQLKRLLKLQKSPKAKEYLSSDVKFAILQKFL